MMTLAQASSYFDHTEVTDPYTGSLLFRGQVEPFEDAKRDAYSAYRRVLSVAPTATIPAHRTVDLLGERWIVGQGEPDGMQELHRRKYVLSPVTAELNVSSLSQYLAGVTAYKLWAAPYWVKDAKQESLSSEMPHTFDVFLPSPVAARMVLWNASGAYLTLSQRPMPSGFFSAFSLQLDHAPEVAALVTRVYDPVAGAYVVANPAGVPVKALRVRWQNLFEQSSEADRKYEDGDVSVVLPTGTVAGPGSVVKFAERSYQVLATDIFGGAVVAHARGL